MINENILSLIEEIERYSTLGQQKCNFRKDGKLIVLTESLKRDREC